MKLYVNGCSYTYGHETNENLKSIKEVRPNWTWSDHLANHFDKLINEAWPGGSNHRAVRRTLKFFDECVDPTEWIAVIQITDPISRFEFFSNSFNMHVGVLADYHVLDDRHYRFQLEKLQELKDQTRAQISHRLKNNDDLALHTEWFQQLIELHTKLDGFGVKHLFIPMSSRCSPRVIIDEHSDDEIKKLYGKLPQNLFLDHISKVTNKLHNDGHPDKQGHKEIYEYILSELQKRNYL